MNRLPATLTFVLAMLACGGGALYFSRSTASGRFSARTTFRVLHNSAPDVFSSVPVSGKIGGNWLDDQIALISSPTVLMRVVNALHLNEEWDISPEKALERVEEWVVVTADRGPEIIFVTARGDSPGSAAALANTVRSKYEEIRIEPEQEKFRRLTQNVETQTKEQEKSVEKWKLEMDALQRQVPIDQTPEEARQQQLEYNAAKQSYESSMMLLNTMRELSARLKVEPGIIKSPIEVIEEARP